MSITCPESLKRAYPSRKAAKRVLREMRKQRHERGGRLIVYRCAGHWHIGHNYTLHSTWRERRGLRRELGR